MQFQIQYEYEDFVRGKWPRQWPPFWTIAVLIWFFVSLVLLIAAATFLGIKIAPAWFLFDVLPLLLIVFILRNLRRSNNEAGTPADWANNPWSSELLNVQIDSEGASLISPSERRFIKWAAVRDVYTNEHQFRIAAGNIALIIPKRIFNDESTLEEFSATLQRCYGRPLICSITK